MKKRYMSNTNDYFNEQFITNFGKVVRRIRHQNGQTQDALADKSQLHRTYISDIERGCRNITLSSATKVATGLDAEFSYLISETEKLCVEPETVNVG